MVNDVDWRKLLIRPPGRYLAILPAEQTTKNRDDMDEGNDEFCL
jgi:hypothetical protein